MKHNYVPGKAYKMRNGGKAFYVGENPTSSVFPLVFVENNGLISHRCVEGYVESKPDIADHDIIGEWPPEPKKVKGWVNVYSATSQIDSQYMHVSVLYDSKQTADLCAVGLQYKNRIACIPIEFTEGEGL